MNIVEAFDKWKSAFPAHNVILDHWGGVYYIIVDGEPAGILCGENIHVGEGLPKITFDREEINKNAYSKEIFDKVFVLVRKYIHDTKRERQARDKKYIEEIRIPFQENCRVKLEQLKQDGKIEYDELKFSRGTESVYAYNKEKKCVLRVSTHISHLKNANMNSVIIKPEDIEHIENFLEIPRD
jgi:hypothetical protein